MSGAVIILGEEHLRVVLRHYVEQHFVLSKDAELHALDPLSLETRVGASSLPSEPPISFVCEVFGCTEWLELLRDMVAAGQLKLRVAGEYAPEQTADAQRALEAGGLRGRPVILF